MTINRNNQTNVIAGVGQSDYIIYGVRCLMNEDELLHKSLFKQIRYLKFQIRALAAAIAACYLTF